jgi:hypothetical protein
MSAGNEPSRSTVKINLLKNIVVKNKSVKTNAIKNSTAKAIAVKTLVEFAAKSGSLDRRFTP